MAECVEHFVETFDHSENLILYKIALFKLIFMERLKVTF